jgi:hypothetical protein
VGPPGPPEVEGDGDARHAVLGRHAAAGAALAVEAERVHHRGQARRAVPDGRGEEEGVVGGVEIVPKSRRRPAGGR